MLQPLKQQVIVRQLPRETTTASGIVLTSESSGNAEWVEIVSLGPAVGSDLRPGYQVIVDWNHARHIKYQDENYFAIPEAHIILVKE